MKLKLLNKRGEAKDIKSFIFEKPDGFKFEAGQYIYITLPKLNYPDERGNIRHFTISSSPSENFIQITTRIRPESGYKKTLDELLIGDTVEIKGPQGVFVFVNHYPPTTNHLFLAGGIGITPFRSIIKHSADIKSDILINLIYSNSDSDFVFKKEFDLWQKENDFLKIKYVNTLEEGRIDYQKLNYILSEKTVSFFWIVGPNPFVNAMEDILQKLNIPETNIKTEKFIGY